MITDTSIPPPTPWHEGERLIQERVGTAERMARVGFRAIRDFMPDQHRDFFAQLPFLVVGSVDREGLPWASLLSGPPGFARSPDPRRLVIKAQPIAGDPLQAALLPGAKLGILGIELPTRRRNRMNGTVVVLDEAGFEVRVDQSFGNCPQYIQVRDMAGFASRQYDPAQAFSQLDVDIRDRIAAADTFFVATSSGARAGVNAGVDVSHRGGKPGFIRVDGDTLTIPDFKGNRYFNTFGNLMLEPRAALLFLDFQSGNLLHLQGHAEVLWEGGDELRLLSGAERLWRLHVERGSLRSRALGLRWSFRELAPTTAATGVWHVA